MCEPTRGRGGGPAGPAAGGQRGSVALEVVLVAPALLLVALAVLAVLGPVTDLLAAEEAARAAARAVAVSGETGAAHDAASEIAPDAEVAVTTSDGLAVVRVTLVRDVLGRANTSTARAAAPLEPAVAG